MQRAETLAGFLAPLLEQAMQPLVAQIGETNTTGLELRPAVPARGADASAGTPGISRAPGLAADTGQCAKTLPPLAGPTQRRPLRAGTTLPGPQKERLIAADAVIHEKNRCRRHRRQIHRA